MKTVLIIAFESAPFHRPGSTIGAQRPYQFAKHLPNNGWRTIVLCCDFKKRWKLDKSELTMEVNRLVHEKMDAIHHGHSVTIALPSLRYADHWDRAWSSSVEINTDVGTFVAKPGLANSVQRKVASFFKLFRGDYSQSWQEVAFTAAMEINKTTKIDFIIAEHGPDAGVYVAKKLSSLTGIKWCVDFRDPVLRSFGISSRLFVKWWYQYLLKSATFLISVNDYLKFLDEKFFPLKGYVITNGFDPDEMPSSLSNTRPNELTIFYGGNVNPIYQDISIFFKALFYLKQENLKCRFFYFGNAFKRIESLANDHGVSDFVISSPPTERDHYLKAASQVDLLLILSLQTNKDVHFLKGLHPGKVFESFGLRKPIISVPSDNGLLDDLLKETNTGKSFSQAKDLALFLTDCIQLKAQGKEIPYNPTAKVNDYTRPAQIFKLAQILDENS